MFYIAIVQNSSASQGCEVSVIRENRAGVDVNMNKSISQARIGG